MAFDRDRGRGRSFGRRDDRGGRGFDRPREMTKVVCSNCGKETEVPFKPTGDRPVYCRECFAKMGGPEPRRSSGGDRREQRPQGPNNSAQLAEINSKLDRLIKLLTPAEQIAEKKETVKKKRAVKKAPEATIEPQEESQT